MPGGLRTPTCCPKKELIKAPREKGPGCDELEGVLTQGETDTPKRTRKEGKGAQKEKGGKRQSIEVRTDMHLSTDASREGTAAEKQLMQNHAVQDPCKTMQCKIHAKPCSEKKI